MPSRHLNFFVAIFLLASPAGAAQRLENYFNLEQPAAGDRFGQAAAIDGNQAVVGAPGVDSGTLLDTGAVFVFANTPSWQRQAVIRAPLFSMGDEFGHAVAISGNTVVVGAPFEDGGDSGAHGDPGQFGRPDSGAVYVYVRTGSNWVLQAYLKALFPDAHDHFGHAVAIDGDTLLIGAPGEDSGLGGPTAFPQDNSISGSGAAYVWIRNGSNWTQQAYLKSFGTAPGLHFGSAVAMAGDTAVVGAPDDHSGVIGVDGVPNATTILNSGSAYVFERTGSDWTQQAYLRASNPGSSNRFGQAIAVEGNTIVVGARHEAAIFHGPGAAYVFERTNVTWRQTARLTTTTAGPLALFGSSVAVHGDQIAVGAPRNDGSRPRLDANADDALRDAGAVYLFERQAGEWRETTYLKSFTPVDEQLFGASVDLQGTRIVVGAPQDRRNNSAVVSGGVSILEPAGAAGSSLAVVHDGREIAFADDATPIDVDFGESKLTERIEREFIITNRGETNITFGVPTVGGFQASSFLLNPPTNNLLAPHATARFTVAFAPLSTGNRRAFVRITNTLTGGQPLYFGLRGFGVSVPEFRLFGFNDSEQTLVPIQSDNALSRTNGTDMIPRELDFSVTTNEFRIENQGSRVLTVQIALNEPQTSAFSLLHHTFLAIQPGEFQMLRVRFEATVARTYDATITLTHNDPAQPAPFRLNLRGEGTPNGLGLLGSGVTIHHGDSDPSLEDGTDFDLLNLAATRSTSFVLTNRSDSIIFFSQPVITGPAADEFRATILGASGISPGRSRTFLLTFDPAEAGLRPALVSITNDGAGHNPLQFGVQGAGVVAPLIQVSGVTDYLRVNIEGPGRTNDFQIENVGSSDLEITDIGLHGDPSFRLLDTFVGRTLPPRGFHRIRVHFHPATLGHHFATLSITNNASPSGRRTFSLRGEGVREGIEVLGDADLGGVAVKGGSIERTFTITNHGPQMVNVWFPHMSSTNTDFQLLSGAIPGFLPVGGTSSFSVLFNPLTTGAKSTTIWVTNDFREPLPLVVQGEGIGPEVFPRTDLLIDYLKAQDAAIDERFGTRIAVDGDTLVVGVPNESSSSVADATDKSAPDAGAAYVFVRSTNGWVQQAYLKAPKPRAGDRFGAGVSVSMNTILVGAPGEDNLGEFVGAAFVYERSGTNWMLEARLDPLPGIGQSGDRFGEAVSVSGNNAVVGTPGRRGLPGVYTFERTNGVWAPPILVLGWNTLEYGSEISHDENVFLVGAPDSAGGRLALIYEFGNYHWQAVLWSAPFVPNEQFGAAVAIDGDRLAIGAPTVPDSSDPEQTNAGRVIMFERGESGWHRESILLAPFAGSDQTFGSALSLRGDSLVIGAPGDRTLADGTEGALPGQSLHDAGAVYLYEFGTTNWRERAYFKAPNAHVSSRFGESVAITGNEVLIGAPGERGDLSFDGTNYSILETNWIGGRASGAVYAFDATPIRTPGVAVFGNGFMLLDGERQPLRENVTDFGRVPFEGGVVGNTYIISNRTEQTLTVESLSLRGPSAGDFHLIEFLPRQLFPHSTIHFGIQFAPLSIGVHEATVAVNVQGAEPGEFDFLIRGEGYHAGSSGTPDIRLVTRDAIEILNGDLSPRLLDGTDLQLVSVTNGMRSREFIIQNNANRDLLISDVLVAGDTNDFSIITPPDNRIRPLQASSMSVRFDPTQVGLRSARISIANNDPQDPVFEFAVQGTGYEGARIGVLGATDFGTLNESTGVITNYFSITNFGDFELHLLAVNFVQLSGANPGDFRVVELPDSPVSIGGSTRFGIAFRPRTTGMKQAVVRIPNSSANAPFHEFLIQGQADIAPVLEITGNTNFGPHLLGAVALTNRFVITNAGFLPINLSPFQKFGPAAEDFTIVQSPESFLPPGVSTTMDIKFAASVLGERQATVRIPHDGGISAALELQLAGEGQFPNEGLHAQLPYGAAVDMNGSLAVVGDPITETARIYHRRGTNWSLEATLAAPNPTAGLGFGSSVAVAGQRVVIGAPNEGSSMGAVYVFERGSGGWSLQGFLKASNPDAGDSFGTAVDIDGDYVIVGAPEEDSATETINGNGFDNDRLDSGAVYVFARNGFIWTQQAYLKSTGPAGGNFGSSVAIDGKRIAVGAPGQGAGEVWTFVRSEQGWMTEAHVLPQAPDDGDRFGHAVALSGDTLVITAPLDDDRFSIHRDSGAACVYVRTNGEWHAQVTFQVSRSGDRFGDSVALDGDFLVVGASGEDGSASGIDEDPFPFGLSESGAAYFYRRTGSDWGDRVYVKAPAANKGQRFGNTIGVSGSSLIVGATNGVSIYHIHAVPPVILRHPANQVVEAGQPLFLSADVQGAQTCRWRRNGQFILGATGCEYFDSAITSSEAGDYELVVENSFGLVSSDVVRVTVAPTNELLRILQPPTNQVLFLGSATNYSVVVTGREPIDLQWFRDGQAIFSPIGGVLHFANVQFSDAGVYHFVASNVWGSITSEVATIIVEQLGVPRFARHPTNSAVVPGGTITLMVEPAGFPVATLNWTKDQVLLPGETNTTLVITNASASSEGSYAVEAVNSFGSTTSASANLRVIEPPTLLSQLSGGVLPVGGDLTWSVTATGAGPITYQWLRNGVLLAGETNRVFVLENLRREDTGQYLVRVLNPVGFDQASAWLRVVAELQFQTSTLLPGRRIRVRFGDREGHPITVERLNALEVQASERLIPGEWTGQTNVVVLTNGLLQFEQAVDITNRQRFYRVIER